MSVLSIFVTPQRALVCVDAKHGGQCNLFVLPGVDAVVVGRCSFDFFAPLALSLSGLTLDLDELDGMVPAKMRGFVRGNVEQTVALVGWSRRGGRVTGWGWRRGGSWHGIVGEPLEQCLIEPNGHEVEPWATPRGETMTEREIENLARSQVRVCRQRSANDLLIERLILASVDSAGVKISSSNI